MNCLDPSNQSLFNYDSGKEAILIAQNITAGQYKINMTLADDHSENPLSSNVFFTITIEEADTNNTPEIV